MELHNGIKIFMKSNQFIIIIFRKEAMIKGGHSRAKEEIHLAVHEFNVGL